MFLQHARSLPGYGLIGTLDFLKPGDGAPHPRSSGLLQSSRSIELVVLKVLLGSF